MSSRVEILQRRAEQLARRIDQADTSEAGESVIVFRVGPSRFAISLANLVEVVSAPKVARVPKAPSIVAGLIQVRGEIRPVYHLGLLLGSTNDSPEAPAFVLLLRTRQGEFGIGAVEVEDVRRIPLSSRKPALTARGHADWMTEDLVPILLADSLLKKEE